MFCLRTKQNMIQVWFFVLLNEGESTETQWTGNVSLLHVVSIDPQTATNYHLTKLSTVIQEEVAL